MSAKAPPPTTVGRMMVGFNPVNWAVEAGGAALGAHI